MKWGALIKETYSDTIAPVDYFTEELLHGETAKDVVGSFSRSVKGEPILLLRAGAY